jgi:hypothetical protein
MHLYSVNVILEQLESLLWVETDRKRITPSSERQQRKQNEDPPNSNSSQTEPFSHLKKPVKDFT